MTDARRWIVVVVLAVVVGGLAGWLVHRTQAPSPEDHAREAAETIKRKVGEIVH